LHSSSAPSCRQRSKCVHSRLVVPLNAVARLLACFPPLHFDRTVSTWRRYHIAEVAHREGLVHDAIAEPCCCAYGELIKSSQCFVPYYKAVSRLSLMRLSGSHDYSSATANGLSVKSLSLKAQVLRLCSCISEPRIKIKDVNDQVGTPH
jgi:hypothetical protein